MMGRLVDAPTAMPPDPPRTPTSSTPCASPGAPASAAYREALAWLFAQRRRAPRDAARMTALMRALALPEPPGVVQVVGSNGKGSVTHMLAAGFDAAGWRSGRFVSPHVEDFSERIAVAGVPISEAEVVAFARRLRAADLSPAPAFFELTLALALEHFARSGVRMAAVEAGVGARHDATRALTRVRAVVLTNVSLEHADTLGGTLEAIARDKADAIRPGIPTVTGAEGPALRVIAEVASQRRSPLFIALPRSPLFQLPAGPAGLPEGDTGNGPGDGSGGGPGDGSGGGRRGERPEGREVAAFQPPGRTAAGRLATATLRLLGAPETAVAAALASPPPPARGERFRIGSREVLLDGAHNPAAAALLAAAVPAPYTLLFGALARKQAAATLAPLLPGAAGVWLTAAAPDDPPPTAAPGHTVVVEPAAALRAALAACPPGGRLLVCGSFYLAGRLRPLLRAWQAAETPPDAPPAPPADPGSATPPEGGRPER